MAIQTDPTRPRLTMLKFLSIVGVAGALSAARVANASAATQDQGRWVLSSAGSTVKGHVVTFSVALHPKAGSQAEVARLLDAVSSPDSPQYGQYLGPEQVRVLTATPDAVVDRVATELLPAVCHNTAGSALLCTATAAVAERVLGTTLAQYTHTRTGGTTVKVAVGSGLASRIANYIKLGIYYLNPNARTSGFEMCFAIGSQHQRCWEQNTSQSSIQNTFSNPA